MHIINLLTCACMQMLAKSLLIENTYYSLLKKIVKFIHMVCGKLSGYYLIENIHKNIKKINQCRCKTGLDHQQLDFANLHNM